MPTGAIATVMSNDSLAATPAYKSVVGSKSHFPASFNNDTTLVAINLFMGAAVFSVSVMWIFRHTCALWNSRKRDHWKSPVTVFRICWLCAAIALALRSGAEASIILAWDPIRPEVAARVITIKRYTDPLSIIFTSVWMTLLLLTLPAMESHLRQKPYPLKMMARVSALRRPALSLLTSLILAVGVVWTRG
jgi:hypothetical protein